MSAAYLIEAAVGVHVLGRAELREGMVIEIGRRAEGMTVADPSMSGRHFQLALNSGVVVLTDLGSTNGTFVNDTPVVHPVQVMPDSRILAGETLFNIKPLGGGNIKDTHWHIVAVPPGMEPDLHFGFKGHQSATFAENVVCKEEIAGSEVAVADYARRQLDKLRPFAPDLVWSGSQLPEGFAPGEHLVCDITLTYQQTRARQVHFYMRSGPRIGVVVWTYPEGTANYQQRFLEILATLRFE